MAAMSVSRVRDSPFRESEWDRRLDNMLEDLESRAVTTTGGAARRSHAQQQQSFSSSQQQSYSYSSSQDTRSHHSSSFQQRSGMLAQTSAGRGLQQQPPAAANFSLAKSPSGNSMRESADETLRDLEQGVLKSMSYIQESHKKVSGPGGTQEWHEVRRGGDPPSDFNLEQQVQHMMPAGGGMQERRANFSQQSSSVNKRSMEQKQQQQQLTTYKVQSNQYSGASDRLTSMSPTWVDQDDDNRPGSRLKQNIDDLDTLLSDLNNARNLSPDGADYTASSVGLGGMDSDDYSESVGQQGHVKRTVNAFNEYSANMAASDYSSRKPPSPAPRRKANISPGVTRKAASSPSWPQQQQQQAVAANISSFSQSSNSQSSSSYKFQAAESSGQQDRFLEDTSYNRPPYSQPGDVPPSESPDLGQPSFYTKYHSSRMTASTTQGGQDLPPAVPFPTQPARSPTPQSPPKQVDELMSEFSEFDTGRPGGYRSTPLMFGKPAKSSVVVTELPDEPPPVRMDPEPVRRDPSPPRPKSENRKGPDVYYPPGTDFSKSGGSPTVPDTASFDRERKVRAKDLERGKVHNRGMDTGDKQGAAVIPICLPLCCATPCAIL